MIQDTVFVVTVVLMLVVAGAFAYVALNAGKAVAEYPPIQQRSQGMRVWFFWILIVAGVLIAVVTMLDLPYAATRGDTPDDAVTLEIEGRQWYWEVGEAQLTAGDTVIFNVTSGDVNHGLGLYDPAMRMVGQTQAMPGYLNVLSLTLEQPGTYTVLCMEYCGLVHHAMVSEITVGE
ncbi:MAG: cytochrome C oxidase subunit II [Gammaproteobacteria bacterium]|nr:cytochrome C oxidase subunit II [Gammaproteobacteria bacterium]